MSIDSGARRQKTKRTSPAAKPPREKKTAVPLASRRTFIFAAIGGLLLWASLDPLGWWTLAWIAAAPWLWMASWDRLPGRRPYLVIWAVGLAHWLAVLQGIRLAHWAVHFGWVLLSLYLAFYLPLFIGLLRTAVHRMKVPLVVAAPVIWTGLELVRAYFATGFSITMLGHTQLPWTSLIQIADIFGAYGVSFLVMFVTACAVETARRLWPASGDIQAKDWRKVWPAPAMAVIVLVGVVAYGRHRLASFPIEPPQESAVKVALIQQPVPMFFASNREENIETFGKYFHLSQQAIKRHDDIDVIVWPESIFSLMTPLVTKAADVAPPPDSAMADYEMNNALEAASARFRDLAANVTDQLGGRVLLTGGAAFHYLPSGSSQTYNSAMLIDGDGNLVNRYDKMHPVMFGEYVPFGRHFPWLYGFTPLSSGLTEGDAAKALDISGVRLAPNICFESTVPHLIRRHFRNLASQGKAPDAFVSVTNDGWFHGSAILDYHFACGAFRAIEHRRPFLIAANAGFSAWIDAAGRVRAKGPRADEAVILAAVAPADHRSWQTYLGDWPAALCLMFCMVAGVAGVWHHRRPKEN